MTNTRPAYTVLDALHNLRRVALAIPENHLDMSSWGSIAAPNIEPNTCLQPGTEGIGSLVNLDAPACGTTMCLAGWAAQDPWFQERGFGTTLHYDVGGMGRPFGWLIPKISGPGPSDAVPRDPYVNASKRMVGLPSNYCEALFSISVDPASRPRTVTELLAVVDHIIEVVTAGNLDPDIRAEQIIDAAYDKAGIDR